MLLEISVQNLGVIDQMTLQVPTGMIALTGETGAGKTLLVDAINLLMGGRADPSLVRTGSTEATVDGRFEIDGDEVVLTRVIPSDGRSRAYVDGRPSTASALAELGATLVDLHGQHAHQSLLASDSQRDALDVFGSVDVSALNDAKSVLSQVERDLASLGGNERDRARELDLIRYQVDELVVAGLVDPDEDQKLEQDEELLANAQAHSETASEVLELFVGEDAVRDSLGSAMTRLEDRLPFADIFARLTDVIAEFDDIVDEVRSASDGIEENPAKLEEIQTRRRALSDLRRKYGDTVAAVIAERDRLSTRLTELEQHDERAAALDLQLIEAQDAVASASAVVKKQRQAAAPGLADAIELQLPDLAMPKAKMGIEVEGVDGGEVSFQLSANPGSALQPLSKVASGGELARTMLALRSVLSEAPPVLVFDEVDAGIGGQAGFAVGRSLSNLGDRHQVLVVTHLAQVAAFADAHLAVKKSQTEDNTVSEVRLLSEDERLVEVARMLSGQPKSITARQHARELVLEAESNKLR